jgi:tetratricopeptide (TPR) repeat protein
MSLFLRLAAASLVVALPVNANAAWHKASTKHFVIYSEQKPDELRAYAEKLERFDKAVRLARSMRDYEVGDGNRLTIFVVKSVSAVQALKPNHDANAFGFYQPRASGAVAVVPRSTPSPAFSPDTVFFHEYAHHLMLSDINQPMPSWYVESFAEFMSTAEVRKDGSVSLGLPANHRAANLLSARAVHMSVAELLAGQRPRSDMERNSLYSRGWLLGHYLTFAPGRQGQLATYLDEFAKGRTAAEAARLTFGDLKQLEKEVDQYFSKGKFAYLTLDAQRLAIGPVEVTPLSPAAESAMPLFMRLQTRVRRDAGQQAAEAQKLADAHPADGMVLMTLAEAKWVADDYAVSEAAADQAIALMPKSAEALIWKGRAMLSRAEKERKPELFKQARAVFAQANRLDPENPEPLLYFHRSYLMQGVPPTANAIEGLHYAAKLAPQDLGLAMTSATQHLRDGQPAKARPMLMMIAQHPHGDELGDRAEQLIAEIDRTKAGGPTAAN